MNGVEDWESEGGAANSVKVGVYLDAYELQTVVDALAFAASRSIYAPENRSEYERLAAVFAEKKERLR